VASAAETVPVSRPQVGWSEQDPDHWVQAVVACLDRLAAEAPGQMAAVRGIGLSGHHENGGEKVGHGSGGMSALRAAQ
jgi:xylulokinase